MEYFYVTLVKGVYYYRDQPGLRWVDNEQQATRFTMEDRLVIEKHGFLTGGIFVKVRV